MCLPRVSALSIKVFAVCAQHRVYNRVYTGDIGILEKKMETSVYIYIEAIQTQLSEIGFVGFYLRG